MLDDEEWNSETEDEEGEQVNQEGGEVEWKVDEQEAVASDTPEGDVGRKVGRDLTGCDIRTRKIPKYIDCGGTPLPGAGQLWKYACLSTPEWKYFVFRSPQKYTCGCGKEEEALSVVAKAVDLVSAKCKLCSRGVMSRGLHHTVVNTINTTPNPGEDYPKYGSRPSRLPPYRHYHVPDVWILFSCENCNKRSVNMTIPSIDPQFQRALCPQCYQGKVVPRLRSVAEPSPDPGFARKTQMECGYFNLRPKGPIKFLCSGCKRTCVRKKRVISRTEGAAPGDLMCLSCYTQMKSLTKAKRKRKDLEPVQGGKKQKVGAPLFTNINVPAPGFSQFTPPVPQPPLQLPLPLPFRVTPPLARLALAHLAASQLLPRPGVAPRTPPFFAKNTRLVD